MSIFNHIKNILGQKISPAKEETLLGIKSQTDLLSFDSQSGTTSLNVNVQASTSRVKNVSNSAINPATEVTLVSVKNKVASLSFDANSELKTTGLSPTLDDTLNIKNIEEDNVSLFSVDSTILLRRMVKLMESQATTDGSTRQRVVIDGFGAVVTGVGPSGDGVPLITLTNDLTANSITALTTPTTFLGQNRQMFQDVARDAYARSIRSRLLFQ